MRVHLLTLMIMGIILGNSSFGQSQEKPAPGDRPPANAGRFYSADAASLKTQLDGFFSKAKPRNIRDVTAIIVPHAGYVFSGQVAASGYNQVDPAKQYDNIFLIASSHQVHFEGASVYNKGDYLTPLGRIHVNTEIANNLIRDAKVFSFRSEADKTEHSTEVQLPFLQYHLKKEFRLVPIVIGTQSEETCVKIAGALKQYFNDRNLFVISTDFSHYPSYVDAVNVDKATCSAIVAGSPERLMKCINEYENSGIPNLATGLCGWSSVLVLLEMLKGLDGIEITPVEYKNSGDTPFGDKKQVVGYWSLAVSRKSASFSFSEADKTALLKAARETIRMYLVEGRIPEDKTGEYPESLKIKAGAFVTLKKSGELRGCIGRFSADLPLYRVVREMAVAAATQDSRFDPVTLSELRGLDIEISVLSPMRLISTPAEIVPGKHGIYIKKGRTSGTFLPQVATETGWNTEEFLGHCSRDKAGIGWDGWKSAEVYIYEASVFSEHDISVHKD